MRDKYFSDLHWRNGIFRQLWTTLELGGDRRLFRQKQACREFPLDNKIRKPSLSGLFYFRIRRAALGRCGLPSAGKKKPPLGGFLE